MASNAVSNVEVNVDTWSALYDKLNGVISLINTEVLTSSQNSVGALTSGNVNIAGFLQTLTHAVSGNSSTQGLRGGTLDTPNTLFIHSNVAISTNGLAVGSALVVNNTVHVISANQVNVNSNAVLITLDSTLLSLTPDDANLSLGNTELGINSTSFVIESDAIGFITPELTIDGDLVVTGSVSGNITVDAENVTYTPANNENWDSDTDPGNADAALDQLALRLKTVEDIAGGTPETFTITESLLIGNSTVNTFANSSHLRIANSSAQMNVTPAAFNMGVITANTTNLNIGANVSLSTARLLVGNSTVNAVVNSSSLEITSGVNGGIVILKGGGTTRFRILELGGDNWQIRSNMNAGTTQDDASKPSWALVAGGGDEGAFYRSPPGSASFVKMGGFSNVGLLTANGATLGRAVNSFGFNSFGIYTISASEPSGGESGDLWYQV